MAVKWLGLHGFRLIQPVEDIVKLVGSIIAVVDIRQEDKHSMDMHFTNSIKRLGLLAIDNSFYYLLIL